MANSFGTPRARPKGGKRKAQPLTLAGRASKRSRTNAKASSAIPSTSSHPVEAVVQFPADVTAGEVRLTDIMLNDDATVTCDYALKGIGNMASFVHLGSAFGE